MQDSPQQATETTIQISPSEGTGDHALCSCENRKRSMLDRFRRVSYVRYRIPCVHSVHDPELVSDWLRLLGMEAYIPQFLTHQVTAKTLLSLNSADLRHIGVNRLADRRVILDEIRRQCLEPVPHHLSQTTPEDGRILTHMSNERLLLIWCRIVLIVLTIAVAAINLRGNDNSENQKQSDQVDKFVTIVGEFLSALGICMVMYAFYRYCFMFGQANHPDKYPNANILLLVVPIMLVFIVTVIVLYGIMAHEYASQVSILLLTLI